MDIFVPMSMFRSLVSLLNAAPTQAASPIFQLSLSPSCNPPQHLPRPTARSQTLRGGDQRSAGRRSIVSCARWTSAPWSPTAKASVTAARTRTPTPSRSASGLVQGQAKKSGIQGLMAKGGLLQGWSQEVRRRWVKLLGFFSLLRFC